MANVKNGWDRLSAGVYGYFVNGKLLITRKVKDKPTDDPRKKPTPKPPAVVSPPPVVSPGSFDPIGPMPVYVPVPSNGREFGIDALGGARYRSLYVREHPSNWWVGVFSSTFGDARPLIQDLIDRGGLKGVRVQLLWDPSHTYANAIPLAVAEARKWRPIVLANPQIKFAFAGACENKFSGAPAIALQKAVQAELPGTIYVHSYMPGGGPIPSSPSVWNEVHGDAPSPGGFYSYSFDGTNAFDSDVEAILARHSTAQVFFWWTYNLNLNKRALKPGEKGTPIPQRNAAPTSTMLDSLIYLRTGRGPTLMLPGGIWKTHCEQYKDLPTAADRDNKPVGIVPDGTKRPSKLQLVTDNGQVIAVSGPGSVFGNPKEKRSRYYFNEWGYLLAEKARRIQGHPVCRLIGDGKEFGRINPAFRDGSFR